VELVRGFDLHALVALHVHHQLVVADHRVAEEAELVPCLLRFVVNQLGGEVLLNGHSCHLLLHTVTISKYIVSRCRSSVHG